MQLRVGLILVISFLVPRLSWGQENLVYNHYFLNPYLYNPSYIAPNGFSELYLNYRKQWYQIASAPTTATLNLQVPLNHKMGLGVTAYYDKAGVIKTTTGMASFSYQLYLGQNLSVPHKFGFGLSVGVTNSNIDLSEVDNPNDPALLLRNKTSSMDGQVGINYQYHGLKLAFAIPRIFDSYVVSEESFNTPGIEQIRSTISSVSYSFEVNPRVTLEPYVLYRTYRNQPAQYEVLGVAYFDNKFWAGGSYRQDYGAAAMLGFAIKDQIKLSYSYEFATQQAERIGLGTHELQLAIRLGKKKVYPASRITLEESTEEENTDLADTTEPVEEAETIAQEEPAEKVEEPVVAPVTVQKEPVKTQSEPQPVKTDSEAVAVAKTTVVEADPDPEEEVAEPQKEEREIKSVNLPEKVITMTSARGLTPGHYVVVGVFQSEQNAINYAAKLQKAGYQAEMGPYPAHNYYFVHLGGFESLDQAREGRNSIRAVREFTFPEAWILSVE